MKKTKVAKKECRPTEHNYLPLPVYDPPPASLSQWMVHYGSAQKVYCTKCGKVLTIA